ncbi:MAG: glutamate racemase [Synechococcus sp. SB0665_bin_28]|nr:glutamate racemase [Synechococcus sp. SB0665_bin_28]MYF20559.1 glutamate racemase [Synechococcus sp. SB0677_bin_5]
MPWVHPREDLPIGLFDSGLGGLTVLHQLQCLLPGEPLLYLADSARLPYGERSPNEIRAIAEEAAHWLRVRRVKAMVMACNTMNAVAADVIRAEVKVPVVSLIDAMAASLNLNPGDHVVVLATAATVNSGAYGCAIRRYFPTVRVQEIACPGLVPAIEAGERDSDRLEQLVTGYLAPILHETRPIQALILGCTHYPILRPLLQRLLPWPAPLLDPALPAVMALKQMVQATGIAAHQPRGSMQFCCTGQTTHFATAVANWLRQPVQVEQVSLQSVLLSH